MAQIHESMNAATQKKDPQAEQDAAVEKALSHIKHKLIVMSGKGGVGKTSTSINLAIALANKGYQVGIMDVDLHGPDVPRMLGLKGMLDLSSNKKLEPMQRMKNLKVISIESLTMSKDDAIIWRGPIKYSAIKQFIPDHSGCQGHHCDDTPGGIPGGCPQIHQLLQNRKNGDFRNDRKYEWFYMPALQREGGHFRIGRWRISSRENS